MSHKRRVCAPLIPSSLCSACLLPRRFNVMDPSATLLLYSSTLELVDGVVDDIDMHAPGRSRR